MPKYPESRTSVVRSVNDAIGLNCVVFHGLIGALSQLR